MLCADQPVSPVTHSLAYYGLQTNMGESRSSGGPLTERAVNLGLHLSSTAGGHTEAAFLSHQCCAQHNSVTYLVTFTRPAGLYLKKVLGYPADTASQLVSEGHISAS